MTTTPLRGGAGLGTPRRPGCGPGTGSPLQALLPLPPLSHSTPELRRPGRCLDSPGPHTPLFQGIGTRPTEIITANGWLESREAWDRGLTSGLGVQLGSRGLKPGHLQETVYFGTLPMRRRAGILDVTGGVCADTRVPLCLGCLRAGRSSSVHLVQASLEGLAGPADCWPGGPRTAGCHVTTDGLSLSLACTPGQGRVPARPAWEEPAPWQHHLQPKASIASLGRLDSSEASSGRAPASPARAGGQALTGDSLRRPWVGRLLSSGLRHQGADSGSVYQQTWEGWCRLGGRRNQRLRLGQFV